MKPPCSSIETVEQPNKSQTDLIAAFCCEQEPGLEFSIPPRIDWPLFFVSGTERIGRVRSSMQQARKPRSVQS